MHRYTNTEPVEMHFICGAVPQLTSARMSGITWMLSVAQGGKKSRQNEQFYPGKMSFNSIIWTAFFSLVIINIYNNKSFEN